MKKQYVFLTLGVAILAIVLVIASPKTNSNNNSNSVAQTPATNTLVSGEVAGATAEVKATITIDDGTSSKDYDQAVKSETSALELLKTLAKTDNFELNITSYSFGDLVDGINGVKSDGQKFWSFYVNDKMADVGASQYMVHPSDHITWKFQKLEQ